MSNANATSSLDLGRLALSIKNGESLWIGSARLTISIDGNVARVKVVAPKAIPIIRESIFPLQAKSDREVVPGVAESPGELPADLDRDLVGPWILERQDYERYEDSDETSWVREGDPVKDLSEISTQVAGDPNLRAVNLLSGKVVLSFTTPEGTQPDGLYRHAPCKTCEGHGESVCPRCCGTGEICHSREDEVLGGATCRWCNGTGEGSPCDDCDATGYVALDESGTIL